MSVLTTILDIFIGGVVGGTVVAGGMWGWCFRRSLALTAAEDQLDDDRDELERDRHDLTVALEAERAEIAAEWELVAAARRDAAQPIAPRERVLSAFGRHSAGHATVTDDDYDRYNQRAIAHLNESTGPLLLVGAK